jgi:lysophospholipase L1-like esterase
VTDYWIGHTMLLRIPALPRLLFTYVVVSALAFGAGIAVGWTRWKRHAANGKAYRSFIIREHARQMPPGGTLIMGDSLIERQLLLDICGPTLNAGIEGATSADLQPLVPEVIRAAKPARVVFNVGTNDAYQRVPGPELQAKIERMIAAARGATILVIGVPASLVGTDADVFLRTAASRYGARFIAFPVTNPTETSDGQHLNAAGAARWQATVRAALCPV